MTKVDETASAAPERSHAYMPGLDIFRGVAIVLVLLAHAFSSQRSAFDHYGNPFFLFFWRIAGWGLVGVHLFFVLSGFLISGILIDGRNKPDYYRGFYLRRVLRIAPAYSVMLLVLKATHWITWRYFAICLLYLTNVCSLFRMHSLYGPFWSLSVEEQFYLTWPTIVRRLSNRTLVRVSCVIIIFTPFLRILLTYLPRPFDDWPHKPWGVGDFFAVGALIALSMRSPRLSVMMRRATYPLLAVGAMLVAATIYMPNPENPTLQHVWAGFMLESFLIFWAGCVCFAVLNPRIANIWALRPLVFLADISYGLYLIHQFVFTEIDKRWTLTGATPATVLGFLFLRFSVEVLIAISIAWISRNTLEAFFLRFKPKRQPVLV
jgi:peptidoglycan/LPS O-acetylase OafA/YrhL